MLARPKKERGPRPGALDRDDVWDQPGVTEARATTSPRTSTCAGSSENGIEAVLCDQNYQFAELAELRTPRRSDDRPLRLGALHRRARRGRARGVRRRLLDDPRRAGALRGDGARDARTCPGGCHPELIEAGDGAQRTAPTGHRPLRLPRRLPRPPQAARAGARGVHGNRATTPAARGQGAGRAQAACAPAEERPSATPRIELRARPTSRPHEHLRELASCDVCLAPSRWEGLGLPLYEAIAFGQPAITNDAPPMNEVDHDGVNGAAGQLARKRHREVGDPGARSRRRRAARGDRAPRRRHAAARARRGRGRGARHRAPLGDTVTGIGELLRPRRMGSLEALMGFSDQIDRYRKRVGIVLAGRRAARAHARTAAGAVRLRRHPVGDDAAAADARLASRRRDPGRDALGAEADQGVRALQADRRGRGQRWRSTTSAGATSTSTATSCASGSPRFDPVTAADSIRAFYMLYAEREGKSPLRRQDARIHARRCAGSSGSCPRRASSTSSATAATSRSRTCG